MGLNHHSFVRALGRRLSVSLKAARGILQLAHVVASICGHAASAEWFSIATCCPFIRDAWSHTDALTQNRCQDSFDSKIPTGLRSGTARFRGRSAACESYLAHGIFDRWAVAGAVERMPRIDDARELG
jgi:hypothetical protein